MAVRAFRFWLVNYRRTWRGSIYSSVLSPVLYLGAMGLGLGTPGRLPRDGQPGRRELPGVPGAGADGGQRDADGNGRVDSTRSSPPSNGRRPTRRQPATPLRPADLFRGHLLFTTMRLAMNCAIFLVVMAAFGAARSAWVLAAVPVAVLTGLAFAAPLEAFA